ncbi:hypothetical protein IMG5_100140 [Ichthyophthirius multifiliis]|uniref:Nucleolar GTP-binding protein 2 n=1 Tax=Ichthyophthirius multifiliis TaxID=5932 RepID=G0QSB8_ICHMU|nr:hypothetical protein IMG5_100140 [Ichthyophthirius multifiliis]EGR31865.1 hypothetical protein IMG5_100140 [Ichthyophthirius multifiliis]|eukprot:XP_004035351.1 hypothetical protein IMG5_100140 [Ichthyophthirius multifiliis]
MAKKAVTSKKAKHVEKLQNKWKQNKKKPSKSMNSDNPNRILPGKGDGKFSHLRSKNQIKRLNMYKDKPDMEAMHKQKTQPSRIAPDRKWFGPVRTIDQKSLEKFRVEMAQRSNDPRHLIVRKKKLPISLLTDANTDSKMNILDIEKYEDTFGPKARRKRVKTDNYTYEDMIEKVVEQEQKYDHSKDKDLHKQDMLDHRKECRDKRMEAGQSRRIWEELYKVLDASDVVVQILDSRDPMGTRSKHVEDHIKRTCHNKHLVFILNKCDLVPTWVTAKWLKYLNQFFPTLAYHASLNNPFGKGSLINLLRQFDNVHKDKKHISVGFIGYPNVGKSSVINSIKQKKVCKSAPIPGETRVWQYITLTKRIYLIDCPGVVYYHDGRNDIEVVLKGCIRAEKIDDPSYYIHAILKKADHVHIKRIYGIDKWDNDEHFLELLAQKKGKLKKVYFNLFIFIIIIYLIIKGGEPDIKTVSKIVLMDWQRGNIPFFNFPPDYIPDEEMKNQNNQKIGEEELINDKEIQQLNLQAEQKVAQETQNQKTAQKNGSQTQEKIYNMRMFQMKRTSIIMKMIYSFIYVQFFLIIFLFYHIYFINYYI